jgi:hypothetical protein
MVRIDASPPFEGTRYKSPLKEKTIVSPSGDIAGYLIQRGVPAAHTNDAKKMIANKKLITLNFDI